MKFDKSTPILRIFDETKARDFYVDYLGFNVDWEHRFGNDMPLYMQVSKGECLVHLSEHSGDGSPGSHIRVECSDVKAYHRELNKKKYAFANPQVDNKPWAEEEMSIKDPFSNKIIFFKPKSV